MTVYLVNILYLVLFLVLYWKDRRRMANGFLFFILLVLSGASLLRLAQDTQSEFLYFVVFAVGILVALTLLAGVFILIAISLASALVLLRRERWVPANFLSLSVGLGLVLWMVLNALAMQAPDSVLPVAFYGMLCVDILLFYLLLTFSNFVLSAFLYQLYSPLRRQDYIIVLGCGLLHGSEVSPLLAGRIQRAWKVCRRQVKRGQKPPVLVMSGGQGADEVLPEAQAMKAYAVRLGVPEQDVLTESASKNTWENMLFSKQLIQSREPGKSACAFCFPPQTTMCSAPGCMPNRRACRPRALAQKQSFITGITPFCGNIWPFLSCIKRRTPCALPFCFYWPVPGIFCSFTRAPWPG